MGYCTERRLRLHKVWESWWPKSTPDNAIIEEVLQKSCCCFTVWVVAPSYWNQQFIHSFLAGQGMSQEILIIFCYYCLFKEQWSHNSFSWHHAPNANLWQLQRKDFHAVHVVFWHSIFYCFDYYVSTQVKPCFICKKQVVQHINPFLWKIHGVDYRLTAQLVKS